MRCPAPPSACTEAPRLLTLAAGRGPGGRGSGPGSCSGQPSGASSVASAALERSSARRSAASARSSARRVLSSGRAIAASERSSLEGWASRDWAMLWMARSAASPARRSASAACSAATADAARAWERASCACCSAVSALRKVSCAGEIVERASARARPLRTHVQRRRGRRALCSHEVRVVEVPDRGPARSCSSSGRQGGHTRRFHGAQVTQRGGAWSRH